jgi:TP901 family phage tail tape measure protein
MTGGISRITVEIGGKIAASLGQSLRTAQMQVSTFGRNTTRTMNDAAIAGRKGFKSMFDNALWQQATIGATAFAGAIGLSVKAAMEFDKSMADVRKAIDFKDGEAGVKRFGNQLIKLSTELPYTAAQLSQIAASAGFAGYKESEIIPFTRAAARMGVAFQMTAEQAGDAMVALRASMGLTQPQVENLGDAINYLSDKFQGTVNAADLTEVTRRIGAIGKAAGLTAEQVAGMGAAFLASGTPTEVAATGLKNFLNALTKGEQATTNQQYALATLFGGDGLGAAIKRGQKGAKKAAKGAAMDISQELAKGMQVDPEGTMKSVLEKMAKLPKEQQVSIAGALFGEESKAAIMPLLTNTKLIGQAFDLIRNKQAFAGSMQKEFQNQMGTSAAQAQIFRNGINALGVSIGAAILPSLNAIMKAIGPVLVKFAEFAQNNQGLVTGIVLIGGALAGLVIALPIIAGVITAIGTIGTAMAGVTIGATIAGWLGYIGIAAGWFSSLGATIAGALGVVGPAFAAIGTAITGFVATAVTGFTTFAGAAFTAMLPLLPWIALIAGIGAAIYALVKYWPQISKAAGRAWEEVNSSGAKAWADIQARWGRFTAWVGQVWEAGLGIIRAWAPKVLAIMFPIPALITAVFQRLVPAIGQIWDQMLAIVRAWGPRVLGALALLPGQVIGIFQRIIPGVQTVFNSIVAFIRQTPGKVASVGQAVINAILNGLKSRASALFGWISSTWDRIKGMVSGGAEDPGDVAMPTAAPTPAPGRSAAARPVPGTPPGRQPQFRARGGRIRAGLPYLVGERRAELIVPGMNGTVIPRVAKPVTAAAMAALLATPAPVAAAPAAASHTVNIHAPVTISGAAAADPMAVRRQVELAFADIQRELESTYRALLHD